MRLITFLLCFGAAGAFAQDEVCTFPDWNKLYDAINDTLTVGRAIESAEPESCSDARRFYRAAEEKIVQWQSAKRIKEDQIQFAMVLKRHSDGAFSESIDEFLGVAAEKNPKQFVTLAGKNFPEGKWCTRGMLGNLGDYGSMPRAEIRKKLEARKQALLKVQDTKLKKIVDQCVSVIPR